jgi:hypothetical protein
LDTESVARSERQGSINVVYIPDRISHCPTICGGTNHSAGQISPQTKGRTIMGDKSPKAVHKQSSQKQAKVDKSKQQKQQAVFAKQSANKK